LIGLHLVLIGFLAMPRVAFLDLQIFLARRVISLQTDHFARLQEFMLKKYKSLKILHDVSRKW
jgi:hypothetical protein